jgi:hypothetical protein
VAMTRAIDRLIVSGAVDPTSTRDAKAPIRWILDRLEADLEVGQPVELRARRRARPSPRRQARGRRARGRGFSARPARAFRRGRECGVEGRAGAARSRAGAGAAGRPDP